MFEVNEPDQDDMRLLRELELPVWTAKLNEEVLVGEVQPYAYEEQDTERTTIRCFVCCHPAQFWRFEIVRKSETDDLGRMEQLEVRTGSGTLSHYWPMVLAVANNSLAVGAATKRTGH
ncbi:hypothetical protein ACW910_21720 (plasmid) [Burkholderia ambifaria]